LFLKYMIYNVYIMESKVPIISVVGRSNSGKTTLIVKIVKELKSRGYKVATMKHSHHNLELDTKGKDSWWHTQAGADVVVIASQKMMGILRRAPKEPPLIDIVNTYLQDMDIVVIEGYKTEAIPKIEVFRTEISTELVCKGDKNLVAVVGDRELKTGIPFFYSNNDVSPLVDFLLSKQNIFPGSK